MIPVLANVRNMLGVAAAAAALAARPALSQASVVVLQDGNSTARFHTQSDDGGIAGMNQWMVDGANHLQEEWFWFRVGDVGGERPLSAVPQVSANMLDMNGDSQPDLLRAIYQATTGVKFTLSYQLTGGAAGSHRSDIAEVIQIENTTGSALSLHFYQYSDFDLGGTRNDDTAKITNGCIADQADGGVAVCETGVVPTPSHFEVGVFPNPLNFSLNDNSPTTLSDITGPLTGDTTWAFQWDVTIQPGETFVISKDKQIQPVPEPASLGLLAIGALAVLGRRRRG